MTKPVKKKRAYSSVVRQEQAAHTRGRILDAADGLFASAGYGRTTVAEIAKTANVATDTVYATFGSKGRVLTALIDRRLAPTADVDNVMDRAEAHAVRDELDQRRQIHLFARDITNVLARVRPVYEIMRTASAVEPEMTTVHAEMDGYRLRNLRRVVDWIAAHGGLRVDADRASEIVWALASPDVARMLLDGRGWSQDHYAEWLEDTLIRTLLPEPESTPDQG